MERFILAPTSSEVDLLIEKLRLEFRSAIEEDQSNCRRLTISSIRPDSDYSNIDSQITALENTIHQLQDEILEMCRKVDSEVHEYCVTMEKENNSNKDENEENTYVEVPINSNERELRNKSFTPDNYRQVFPVEIRDFILPLSSGSKSFSTAVTELINIKSDYSLGATDKIREIKQDILDIWSDLQEHTPKDNLECLVHELQAEISEKLETLKDVDVNDPSD